MLLVGVSLNIPAFFGILIGALGYLVWDKRRIEPEEWGNLFLLLEKEYIKSGTSLAVLVKV